jgi:hypothetical protein
VWQKATSAAVRFSCHFRSCWVPHSSRTLA